MVHAATDTDTIWLNAILRSGSALGKICLYHSFRRRVGEEQADKQDEEEEDGKSSWASGPIGFARFAHEMPHTGDWTQVRLQLAENAGEAGKCAQVVQEVLDALTCSRSSPESAA